VSPLNRKLLPAPGDVPDTSKVIDMEDTPSNKKAADLFFWLLDDSSTTPLPVKPLSLPLMLPDVVQGLGADHGS